MSSRRARLLAPPPNENSESSEASDSSEGSDEVMGGRDAADDKAMTVVYGGRHGRGRSSDLRQLTCVGCTHLRAVRLLEGGGARFFARLQHLNLRLSAIAVVVLALPSLVTLDLRDCAELVELQLKCPKLSVLHLQVRYFDYEP
eukprot:7465224-Pyramimonas_sp.AAC.1